MQFKYYLNVKTAYFFMLIAFFCYNSVDAKNLSIKQIDSISDIAKIKVADNNFLHFSKIQKYLLNESQKLKYPKGIAMAYYNLGISYAMLGELDKSIEVFNHCKNTSYAKTNFIMLSEADRFIGEIYLTQKLYDNAIEKFESAINIAKKTKDSQYYLNAINYNGIAVTMESMVNKEKLIYGYFSKAYYYITHVPKSISAHKKHSVGSVIASNLGGIWDKKNRQDSAIYYYQKAIFHNDAINNVSANMNLKYSMGGFFLKNKKYKEAETKFLESLDISKKAAHKYYTRDCYKSLMLLYKETGDKANYQKYSELFIELNDSIEKSEFKSTKLSFDAIINDKIKAFKKTESDLHWLIFGILALVFVVSVCAFCFHKRMKNKNATIISSSEERLKGKRNIILQKEEETHKLKQMVNASFEEVVHLAKENSPEFFTRFQEVYPDVVNKLMLKESKLRISELTLCAYIYLGFNTKDIAKYTFRSISTVKNRKNNLKKKFNLTIDENIELWLKGVI